MKQSYVYIFLCLIVLTACSSQSSSSLTSEKTKVKKVDSILEFKSMITVIFEDSQGNIWFGSHCDGICRYTPNTAKKKGKQFTYFTVDKGLPKGEIHEFAPGTDWSKVRKVQMGNSIRSIQEDKEGNIWVGTGAGICKYDGASFTTIQPEKGSILITDRFKMSKKELDNLWFGNSATNGVYRYDGDQLKHLVFPVHKDSLDNRSSQYAVYSLYKDKDDNMWFGTESGGIFRYDGNAVICINETEKKGIVRSFMQDNTGKIWIANNSVGICYYENDTYGNFTEEFYKLKAKEKPFHSEMLDGGQSIAQDKDGNIWFGTFGDGVWSYDGTKLTHFTTQNGLPNDTVKSIYKDKSGQLWFGIGDEKVGVYHFTGTSFERFGGGEG